MQSLDQQTQWASVSSILISESAIVLHLNVRGSIDKRTRRMESCFPSFDRRLARARSAVVFPLSVLFIAPLLAPGGCLGTGTAIVDSSHRLVEEPCSVPQRLHFPPRREGRGRKRRREKNDVVHPLPRLRPHWPHGGECSSALLLTLTLSAQGVHFVPMALKKGHQIVAFVRNPKKARSRFLFLSTTFRLPHLGCLHRFLMRGPKTRTSRPFAPTRPTPRRSRKRSRCVQCDAFKISES